MPLVWTGSLDGVDWNELSELYRVAPLAHKEPDKLKTVFTNSMFKRFAFDDGKLVAAGRVLAIFEDQALAVERGYLSGI